MAMIDDHPPRKKEKFKEQLKMIETELGKLKSELSNMVATSPQTVFACHRIMRMTLSNVGGGDGRGGHSCKI
jgi:hypothetical protein